ncbi:hypothetical protein HDIA_2656 [Hartmannibacter diazotrophicus]|uniref:Uncharacterized protein n=1 Tax=Hartmannibacter diazotrophicus TaxID=1482074 RepID=A0A2C9D7C0_9HYPH|nr:hypothetical protein HDIA_2656 [Hartmannibacter diazotrophicus]
MEKKTSFRFFNVDRLAANHPTFVESIRRISDIEPASRRERKLAQDYDVRLEVMEDDGQHCICGELTRIQRINMPSEVIENGISALTTINPLGHSIVFRYNSERGILGIQNNSRIISPSRFGQYISEHNGAEFYKFVPILTRDAWERFLNGGVRRLCVSVAGAENLANLPQEEAASIAISRLSEAYDAPRITIEMSMGHGKGGLADDIKGFVRSMMNKIEEDDLHVESMQAISDDKSINEGKIDFLDDVLSQTRIIDYHERDPEINYNIRKIVLRELMRDMNA